MPIKSTNHRAVVALLRAALGFVSSSKEIDDVRKADPFQIMSIATSHRIVETLAPGIAPGQALRHVLEPDAVIFLEELYAANERRNAKIRQTIVALGSIFAKQGWQAVILKGGAIFAQGEDTCGRYTGDIDILFPEKLARNAQRLLVSLGWVESTVSELFAKNHHHLPALTHDQSIAPVEIHTMLGASGLDAILPAAEIIRSAQQSRIAGIYVPTRTHRIHHLGLHAQFNERGWQEKRLRLSDIADLHRLSAVHERLEHSWPPDFRIKVEALHAAASLLLEANSGKSVSPQAEYWAKTTIRRLGQPNAIRRARLLSITGERMSNLLTDAELRRYWVSQLRDPRARSDFARRVLRRLTELR